MRENDDQQDLKATTQSLSVFCFSLITIYIKQILILKPRSPNLPIRVPQN